jgi:DNA replication and repair protein RecF
MPFRAVKLFNFRNLNNEETIFNSKNIILVGKNGQGKTNFLEALYTLCFGGSFRTKRAALLCRFGETDLSIIGKFETEDKNNIDISFKFQNGHKEIKVNEKLVKDRKELIDTIPCIVFCHDDIEFIHGSPDRQRWFFNQTLSLYNSMFIDELRKYNKILKMRNTALKENRNELIDVYDIQLSTAGRNIIQQRIKTADEFNTVLMPIFKEISGIDREVRVVYRSSWKEYESVDEIQNGLKRVIHDDIRFGTTTRGPHRDRFLFHFDGRIFKNTASTGQIRLLSLIMRVAQASFYFQKSGRKPILLLDDVLLEMDAEKRERFYYSLPDYEQAFYTFLPCEDLGMYTKEGSEIFCVENGRLFIDG